MRSLDKKFDELIAEFRTNGEQLDDEIIKRYLLKINQLIDRIGKERIFHPNIQTKLINFSNKYHIRIDEYIIS